MEPGPSSSSKLLRKPRSLVWNYFVLEGNGDFAKCTICQALVKRVGGNTTTLARHLASKHNVSREDAEDEAPEGEEEDGGLENSQGRRQVPTPKQPSHVWEYFSRPSDSKEEAVCGICHTTIKTAQGTTTPLARHLKSKHGIYPKGKTSNSDKAVKGRKIKVADLQRSHSESDEDENYYDHVEVQSAEHDGSDEEWKLEANTRRSQSSRRAVVESRKRKITDLSDPDETCFICNGNVEVNRELAQQTSEVEYRFLFTEILELPRGTSLDYLEQLERPEKWIGLCKPCQELLEEAILTRKKIERLQVHLEQRQRQMLEGLKKVKSKTWDKDFRKYPKKQRQVLEGIQKYVHSRKYSALNYDDYNDEMEVEDGTFPDAPPSPRFEDDDTPTPHQAPYKKSPRNQRFFCGLCDDQTEYQNEALLTAHTNQVHRSSEEEEAPPSHSPKTTTSKKSLQVGNSNEELQKQKKNNDLAYFSMPPPCKSRYYRYDCPNCPKVKEYAMAKYALHLAIHQRRPYQCSICSEFFPMDDDLQHQHWTEKHSDIQPPPNADKFTRIKFVPGKLWKCDSCQEGFFSEEDRNDHELHCIHPIKLQRRKSLPLARRKPHQCQTCQLRFRNIAEWRFHRVLTHPEADSKSCYFCDKSFFQMTVDGVEALNEKKLVDHMNLSHRTKRIFNECESCGLVFDNRDEKKEHMMGRHGIPEACGICGAHHSYLSTLRKHITNAHFRTQSYICDICGSKFLLESSLLLHKFQNHEIVPDGHEILSCPEKDCGFQSILPQFIRKHVWQVHRSEKSQFLCKFCGKAFKIRSNLKGHLELHLNKDTKPYQCEICGISYAVKNYLSVHKRLTHEKGVRKVVKKRYVYGRSKSRSVGESREPVSGSSSSKGLTPTTTVPTDGAFQSHWLPEQY